MENLHLIVGLGNPGAKYARTRHNIGFQLVDRLAGAWRAQWLEEKKFNASIARVERDGKPVTLVKPLTFMNDSGEAVAAVARFYRLPASRVLIAVDDADLPLGEIRLRPKGSTGGHHGLESVVSHLGTQAFPRLRMGIGRTADGKREITGYVLAPFAADEMDLLEQVLKAAASQTECWLNAGVEKAMNEFNGAVNRPEQKRKTE